MEPGDGETGTLISGLDDRSCLRWAAVDLTGPLGDARGRLDLSPVAAGALGRCLTAAVLVQRMSTQTTSRIILSVAGDGPLKRVMAEAAERGEIRGMVSDPHVEVPTATTNELGVSRAIGNGLLSVWREDETLAYQSQVDVHRGSIGEAVARFLAQSEQTRSAILMGVLAAAEGVVAAGGMMIEALPGGEDAALARMEERLHDLESVSRLLHERGLEGLVGEVLGVTRLSPGESREIRYRCRCSTANIGTYLSRLDSEEREAMRTETGLLEAECVFCGAVYRFRDDGLAARSIPREVQ